MRAAADSARSFIRRHPWIVATLGLSIVVLAVLAGFDRDRLRPPLERVLSDALGRSVSASHLDLRLIWPPRVRVENLRIANPEGFDEPTMARIGTLEFTVSPRDAWSRRLVVPSMAIADADVLLERRADGADNWTLPTSSDSASSSENGDDGRAPPLRIERLSIDRGRIRYRDAATGFDLDLRADTVDPVPASTPAQASASASASAPAPASASASASASAPAPAPRSTPSPAGDGTGHGDAPAKDTGADEPPLRTRLRFNGHYQRARFDGEAMTGDVLSLQRSGVFFPIRGHLTAGTTRLSVDGRVADIVHLGGVDVRLEMAGQTLGNLYPFLLLPLPATPPYQLAGRLVFADGQYRLTDLDGRIGSSDIGGEARYTPRTGRPLLEADLHSRQLVMADLGPLIGVQTKAGGERIAYDQQTTATRPQAQAAERRNNADRVLPAGRFDPERMRAIDADVKLKADKLKLIDGLPLETLDAALRLDEGRLRLEPFRFGLAGGTVDARALLDGHQKDLDSTLSIDLSKLQVARLVPDSPTIAQGAGTITGRLELRGRGNSIADAAAKADGSLAAVIDGGRISNLLDAAAGLNGGKVLTLLLGGDREIRLRCGGVAFDIRNGHGRSTMFVIDTEQTQILGDGQFDLDTERFDLKVSPRPKEAGILSLRTPVHLYGSFRSPDYRLEKLPLAARLGGAIALAGVAPPAALLALIETGGGETTDCGRLLKQAHRSLDR
ncbi:MAG: AsmA family protein [Burkholderiaceae bacterium]